MPQLVIADDAYKVYPGGVIVLRAADWLGAARGTLTTEVDALAPTATVVRDSQQVSASIRTAANTAFQEADDTFEIAFADLPMQAGIRYNPYILARIEGDWDVTNSDTLRESTQEKFRYSCDLRWYGDSQNFLSDTDTSVIAVRPRNIDQYRVLGFGTFTGIGTVSGGLTEVLHWRAYAQAGTTIEWLISQIYLVPTGTAAGTQSVPGVVGTFSIAPLTDGADGGDANGKFTWHPIVLDEQTGFVSDDGGGDYQQQADASSSEYLARVTVDDFFSHDEPSSACYAVHGPFHVPTQVWATDDFSRSVGDGDFSGADGHFTGVSWGDTPEGFGWVGGGTSGSSEFPTGPQDGTGPELGFRVGKAMWVNGSEGVMDIRGDPAGTSLLTATMWPIDVNAANQTKARVRADNLIYSGRIRADMSGAFLSDATRVAIVDISTGPNNVSWINSMNLQVDLKTGDWLVEWLPAGGTTLAGPFSSSWWSVGGDGSRFKVEIRRYLYRVKVWDATLAEPAGWDYEEFRPLWDGSASDAYPYGDDLDTSIQEGDAHTPYIRHFSNGRNSDAKTCQFYFDDFQLEHDAGGAEDSAWASIEQPEGQQRGQIEVPAGSQHLVYWGSRNWTVQDAFLDRYLDFSAKCWNPTTAAELQRSEALWWHFIPAEPFRYIAMNWASSNPQDITRIHQ